MQIILQFKSTNSDYLYKNKLQNLNQKQMKKLNFFLMIMIVSLSVFPTTMLANEKNSVAIETTSKEVPAEIQLKLDRLEEIKDMDKSDLSRSEKKELRKEVKEIKADLKSSGNGLYLSVGAIIIIILLLILLL